MQNFSDTLGQVYRAIMANKLRSFLTMFGIAWGVGSLLVLVGLGEGFRSGQHKNFASLGNDVVMMFNGTIPALANQHTGMRPYQLTLRDEEDMRRLPELRSVTAELSRSDLYEVSQWSNTSGHVTGVEPNCTIVRNIPMFQGRFISDADLRENRRVVVLGQKVAQRQSRATHCTGPPGVRWQVPSPGRGKGTRLFRPQHGTHAVRHLSRQGVLYRLRGY